MSHPVSGPAEAPLLQLMSFNLRRRLPISIHPRHDPWKRRAPLVQRLLLGERPSVLGVQEALPEQDEFVHRALGDDYGRVGGGRNADGSDERCSVFYDATRLRLVRWHQVALSTTPDRPGSRSWGAPFPRIATFVTLQDTATRLQFSVVNTHLDPFSARSRLASARLLLRMIADVGPAVAVMGDFNAARGSAAVEAMTSSSMLRDSWEAAEIRSTPEYRTYSSYRTPRPGARIDWIFVGPGLRVETAAVAARRFEGRAASDHEPVQAIVEVRTADSTNTDRQEPR